MFLPRRLKVNITSVSELSEWKEFYVYRTVALTIVVVTVGWCSVALACDVPVFRYALERWEADPYEVVIFHHGGLSKAHSEAAAALAKVSFEDKATANVAVTVVDLNASPDPTMLKLWNTRKGAKTPYLVVRYPIQHNGGVFWSGPFSADAAARVLNSPARREVAKRILAGESAVWVMLESGDAKQDDAAEALLKAEFRKLEKLLSLPKQYEDDESWMTAQAAAQLRIAFSLVRVSRKERAEEVFIDMLLDTEAGLRKYATPMVFPVFGRGRALLALLGKGINESNISNVGAFLTGACSCQIKAQNPGTDLLMAIDWEAGLTGSAIRETKLPDLTGLPATFPAAGWRAEDGNGPAGSGTLTGPTTRPRTGGNIVRNVVLAAMGVLAIMVVVHLALKRRAGSGGN